MITSSDISSYVNSYLENIGLDVSTAILALLFCSFLVFGYWLLAGVFNRSFNSDSDKE